MAAKIFVFLALLALSVSAASAVFVPQCSPSPIASIVPSYLQPFNALGFEYPIVQSYRLQQALAASNIPSLSMILQQPWALQQQQSLAHVGVQRVTAVQHQQQQLLSTFSQLALSSPASYWQQQQQLPFSQLAVANPAVYLQQQQLLPYNQVALANPSTYWQQQQLDNVFSQLAVANPAVYLQQQQLLPYNQVALANPSTYWQQQQLNNVAVANAATALIQQQQSLPFNQLAATNPAAIFQQPFLGVAIF